MSSRYPVLTLGIPLAHSIPSRDVNATTRFAEAIGGAIIDKRMTLSMESFISVDMFLLQLDGIMPVLA